MVIKDSNLLDDYVYKNLNRYGNTVIHINELEQQIEDLQNENIFLRSHLKLAETFFKFELEDLQKENERLRTALNGSEEKRKKSIEYIKSNYIDNPIEFKKDLLSILGGDEE